MKTFFGIKKITYYLLYIGKWECSETDCKFDGWEIFSNQMRHTYKSFKSEEKETIIPIPDEKMDYFNNLRNDLLKYLNYLFDKCEGQSELDNGFIFKSKFHFFLYPNARYLLDFELNKDKDDFPEYAIIIDQEDNKITSIEKPSYCLDKCWDIMKEGYGKFITPKSYNLISELFQNRFIKLFKFITNLIETNLTENNDVE